MKLDEKEFKRFKALCALRKSGKISKDQEAELAALESKKKGSTSKETPSFKPGNDFSWWNKVPELLRDASNYKCNYVAGDELDTNNFPYVVPGVVRFWTIPTYGKSSKATDPLNVWARNLYLKMFQKYRVASSYSAADLGITLIAAVELVKIIATYERIYGVINRYSLLNTNMPYCEEEALGLTHTLANQLRGRLSDFRYDLNELIRRAQRIVLPKDISVIANSISLYGYEYLDHDSPRSQIIMFMSEYFGIYDETDLTAGNVRFDKINYSQLFNLSADNMCVLLEQAVDALIGSDSVQKIMADLVVWFGEEAMLKFLPVPSEYVVVPTYSEEILHKLHNAEMEFYFNVSPISGAVGSLSAADKTVVLQGYRIYQANDTIVSLFSMVNNAGNWAQYVDGNDTYVGSDQPPCSGFFSSHVLDAYRRDLDDVTVTEGCMWKHTFHYYANTNGVYFINANCAFEMLHSFDIFENNNVSNPIYSNINVTTTAALAAEIAGRLGVIDWAPLSYQATTGTDIYPAIFGDLDNVTIMSASGLTKLHRAVIYSGLHTDASVINK